MTQEAPIPARILRHCVEDCRLRPPPSPRDEARLAYLLEAGEKMLIRHGPKRLTIAEFGYAIHMAPATIRRQICDLHHLFSLILQAHLQAIQKAVSAIPRDAENLFTRRREAYFQATRGICDIPIPLHFLLMRDRFLLPPDELEMIEEARRVIGFMLGNAEDPEDTLSLLDHPTFKLGKIEALCRASEEYDRTQPHVPYVPPPSPPVPEAPRPQRPNPLARPPYPKAKHLPPRISDVLAHIPDKYLDCPQDAPPRTDLA